MKNLKRALSFAVAAVMLVVVFFHPIEKDVAAMHAERNEK